MWVGPNKVLKPDPSPKKSPERPQKCKKGQQFSRIEKKKMSLYFQNQIDFNCNDLDEI